MAHALLKLTAMRAFCINIAACLLCLFVIGAGLVLVDRFDPKGSGSSLQITQWPSESPVELAQDRYTLVMFAHPHCAYTKASLEELNRLLARCPGKVVAYVFFLSPSRYPSRWTLASLWQSANRIPGVDVRVDADGAVASQFGTETSGSVLLFSPRGQLLFHGGITAESGCEPNHAAEESILSLLSGRGSSISQTPVYGRPLSSEADGIPVVVSN